MSQSNEQVTRPHNDMAYTQPIDDTANNHPARLPAPALFVKPSTLRTTTKASDLQDSTPRNVHTKPALFSDVSSKQPAAHPSNPPLSKSVKQGSYAATTTSAAVPETGPISGEEEGTSGESEAQNRRDYLRGQGDTRVPRFGLGRTTLPGAGLFSAKKSTVETESNNDEISGSSPAQSSDLSNPSTQTHSRSEIPNHDQPRQIRDQHDIQRLQERQFHDLERTLSDVERHAQTATSASFFGNPFQIDTFSHGNHKSASQLGRDDAAAHESDNTGTGPGPAGKHIFGRQHASALEALRHSQLELAGAWRPSSSGPDVSPAADTSAHSSASESEAQGARDEDKDDIRASATRRKDNDVYFADVKTQVNTVVDKLRKVTEAMKRVEIESRDLWSTGSNDTISTTTGAERGPISVGAGEKVNRQGSGDSTNPNHADH